MADDDPTTRPPARRRRRRWYVASVAVIALVGGFLYVGPLSPQDSGNSFTSSMLFRPVCDGLIDRDQLSGDWTQTDPNDLTNYTCTLNELKFSVARFPGPPDPLGGLIAQLDAGSDPEPLGEAGTTSEHFTWVALTCSTAPTANQLMVRLNWGANDKAVTAFKQFAAAVATRQGCQLPDLPTYRPGDKPRPQPILDTGPVCGLLEPTQLGSLSGWTVTRMPESIGGPVSHCAVSPPVEPNKAPPPSFIISTFDGPFLGSGTDRLTFNFYTRVCRGTDKIIALQNAPQLATQHAFDRAVLATHNIRCTDAP